MKVVIFLSEKSKMMKQTVYFNVFKKSVFFHVGMRFCNLFVKKICHKYNTKEIRQLLGYLLYT